MKLNEDRARSLTRRLEQVDRIRATEGNFSTNDGNVASAGAVSNSPLQDCDGERHCLANLNLETDVGSGGRSRTLPVFFFPGPLGRRDTGKFGS